MIGEFYFISYKRIRLTELRRDQRKKKGGTQEWSAREAG